MLQQNGALVALQTEVSLPSVSSHNSKGKGLVLKELVPTSASVYLGLSVVDSVATQPIPTKQSTTYNMYVVKHKKHSCSTMAWHGMAWHGMAWYGMAWYGMIVTPYLCNLHTCLVH